jgi:hypothetical protein
VKIVTYKEVTQRVTDKTTICDFCQKEIRRISHFDRSSATIEVESGEVYPEGGTIYKYVVDICTDCFIDRVKPWVESQGIEFREEEIDY